MNCGENLEFDTIYFDMDGVLADFGRGVMEMCQMDVYSQFESYSKEFDDRMYAAIRDIPNFYFKLEPMDGMI